jgi:ribonucleoside-diphosphate reductase alpha chain
MSDAKQREKQNADARPNATVSPQPVTGKPAPKGPSGHAGSGGAASSGAKAMLVQQPHAHHAHQAVMEEEDNYSEETEVIKIVQARIKGYEGDPCSSCGSFTLVRNGTCMKCDSCGSTSGCS